MVDYPDFRLKPQKVPLLVSSSTYLVHAARMWVVYENLSENSVMYAPLKEQ